MKTRDLNRIAIVGAFVLVGLIYVLSAVTGQQAEEDRTHSPGLLGAVAHAASVSDPPRNLTVVASEVTAQENSTSTPPTMGGTAGGEGERTAAEAPSTPGRPSLSGVSHSSISLSWGAVSGATSYEAQYQDRDDNSQGSQVNGITGTSYTFSGLSPNTRYVFWVRARNTAGVSSWSPMRYGTTTTAPSPLSLPVPSDRTLTIGVHTSFTLPPASGGNAPYTYVMSGLPPGLSFNTSSRTVSGTPTTLGTWTVTYSVTDSSSASRNTTFTITVTTAPVPSPPDRPSVTGVNHSSVTLSWGAVTGATHYDIRYRNRDGGGPNVPGNWVQVNNIPGTSYTVSGLSPSTRYEFEVRAGNNAGDSGWSPNRYATTTASPPTPPTPTATPTPPVSESLSATPTTIYVGEKTKLEASGVTPSNTQLKLVYDTKLTHRELCPAIRSRSNHDTVILPTNGIQYLKGCWPGRATVSLRTVNGDVELDSVNVTVHAPGVVIKDLASSLEQGQQDEFTVSVSNISSSSDVAYSITMLAGDADLSFTDCAKPETTDESGSLSGSASHDETFTLYGCAVGGATIFASLIHEDRTVGLDSQFVTVTEGTDPGPGPGPAPTPTPTPTPTPLGKPQNVTYTPDGMTEGRVELSWDSASGATGYEVWQCTAVTSDGCDLYAALIQGLGSGTTTWTVSDLDTDKLHKFKIRATNDNESEDSDVITFNLRPAPQNLEGGPGQHGQITLTWDPVPNPDIADEQHINYLNYHVEQLFPNSNPFDSGWERLSDEPHDGVTIGTITTTNDRLQVVVSGLTPGEEYEHRIKAESVQGKSEASNVVTTTATDERPSGPPSDLAWRSMLGHRGVRLSWNDDSPDTASYEVEVSPTSSLIRMSLVQDDTETMDDRKYVNIIGLAHDDRYTLSVYATNEAGRSEEASSIDVIPLEPTFWWGHQSDHTVRYQRGTITTVNGVDMIADAILPAAEAWNLEINTINGHRHGLLICDDDDISCDDDNGNNLNRDTHEVTIRTVAPTDESDNVSGCGSGYACVDDAPGPSGRAEVGSHMTNMDMIFENPAYSCSTVHPVTGNPAPVCDPADVTEYVWTDNQADHNTQVNPLDNTVRFIYIRWIMLHEFGHTLGLPDFYSGGGHTNYDPNLAGETAIMNLPWDATRIRQTDRYQLDAIYRTHTRH